MVIIPGQKKITILDNKNSIKYVNNHTIQTGNGRYRKHYKGLQKEYQAHFHGCK